MEAVKYSWNQIQFNTTLHRYLGVSSLTFAQSMNKKGFDLSLAAAAGTPFVKRETIQEEIGPTGATRETGQKIRISKKGKITRGRMITEKVFQPLTYILASKALGAGYTQDRLQKKAEQIYGARMKSRAFIKQGWNPAKEVMKRSDRGKDVAAIPDFNFDKLGTFGAFIKMSGADPAKPGFNPQVRLWNSTTESPRMSDRGRQIGDNALEAAFAKVTSDMVQYLDRKMGVDARQFNAAQRR